MNGFTCGFFKQMMWKVVCCPLSVLEHTGCDFSFYELGKGRRNNTINISTRLSCLANMDEILCSCNEKHRAKSEKMQKEHVPIADGKV